MGSLPEHLHPPRRRSGAHGRPAGHRRRLDERERVVVFTGVGVVHVGILAVAAADEERLAAGGDGLDEAVDIVLGPPPGALEAGAAGRSGDEQPIQQQDMTLSPHWGD